MQDLFQSGVYHQAMESDDSHSGNIYTPSELNHAARLHLEAGFGRVWIEGEISNLSRPASGHIYFSLKDAKAQISCALFRSHTHGIGFKPENGMLVRARGRVSLFEARGNYQLIADSLLRADSVSPRYPSSLIAKQRRLPTYKDRRTIDARLCKRRYTGFRPTLCPAPGCSVPLLRSSARQPGDGQRPLPGSVGESHPCTA